MLFQLLCELPVLIVGQLFKKLFANVAKLHEIVRVSAYTCSVNLGNVQFKWFLVGDNVILYQRSSTHIRQNSFQ